MPSAMTPLHSSSKVYKTEIRIHYPKSFYQPHIEKAWEWNYTRMPAQQKHADEKGEGDDPDPDLHPVPPHLPLKRVQELPC